MSEANELKENKLEMNEMKAISGGYIFKQFHVWLAQLLTP